MHYSARKDMLHLASAGFALRFRHVPEVQPINSTLPRKKKNVFPSRGGFGGSCVIGRDLNEIEHPTRGTQWICSSKYLLYRQFFAGWVIWKNDMSLWGKCAWEEDNSKGGCLRDPGWGLGGSWVNFWWVSAAGLSEPPPFTVYSMEWPIIHPILVTFGQIPREDKGDREGIPNTHPIP